MDQIEIQAEKIASELLLSFDSESLKLQESISKDHPQDQEANLIYHYTDDKGLWGILSSGNFWMTSVFNMNDPSEISHGVSLACSVFRHLASTQNQFEVEFSEKFTSIARYGIANIAKFHALSFSFHDDELSQWRSYANDGCGFAIGINKRKLENWITTQKSTTIGGFPIEYNSKKLEQINISLYNLLRPALLSLQQLNLQQPLLNHVLKIFSVSLAVRVIEASTHFKHEGYASEAEFRILEIGSAHHNLPNQKHRLRDTEVVYYTELEWKTFIPDAIETIMIGPGANKEKAKLYIEECLKLHRVPNVFIQKSEIPYRSGSR